jgi:hypothetical protein
MLRGRQSKTWTYILLDSSDDPHVQFLRVALHTPHNRPWLTSVSMIVMSAVGPPNKHSVWMRRFGLGMPKAAIIKIARWFFSRFSRPLPRLAAAPSEPLAMPRVLSNLSTSIVPTAN